LTGGCTPATTAPPAAPTSAPAPSGGAAAAPTTAPVAAKPKRGGVYASAAAGDAPNQDVHLTSTSYLQYQGPGAVYSRLLKFQGGPGRPPLSLVVAGDLAENWQQVDDLSYVFKLRPGVRWHNVAPVRGRELTADDIVYSANRQRD